MAEIYKVLVDITKIRQIQRILDEVGRGDLKDDLEACVVDSEGYNEKMRKQNSEATGNTRRTVIGVQPISEKREIRPAESSVTIERKPVSSSIKIERKEE